ncbi:MAG: hypothetical protein IPM02_22365 [Betaproteobacteria bacterium]|nr:hypothetical protein [Betaproteobacteria bacterium]
MTTNQESAPYDAAFYDGHSQGMSRSAMQVLEVLFTHYIPFSVVDFGCGQGAWLAAAEGLGSHVLRGFDGPWVDAKRLLSKNIVFEQIDFDVSIPSDQDRCDLCISLEVAEHISKVRAKPFVDSLCAASDVVLFSAATRCQGGTGHVNEQRPSYWIDLFRSNDYLCLDLLRPAIWYSEGIEWWYRQNTLLFVDRRTPRGNYFASLQTSQPLMTDIVHPDSMN